MNNYTREDILRMVEEEDVGFIRLQFTDIFGTMKNIAITTSQLEKALDNEIMFDGSSIEGFARVEESDMYLYPNLNTFEIFPWRPQQGIFVNFKNVQRTSRKKIPFGIGQIGKSFRNEITPGNFTFRTREFEQMELEFFCEPGTDMEWFRYWREFCINWLKDLGIKDDEMRARDHSPEELCFYSKGTTDIEFLFPFGWGELWGIADRTDYDLKQHQNTSGEPMEYFDDEKKEKYIPYVVEPSLGADRVTLAFLCAAYDEENIGTEEKPDMRTVLHFHPALAPVKIGVLPLSKKLNEGAEKIYAELAKTYNCEFDDRGNIGKRYRRQDEIGTPFCVTYDFESETDGAVTVRDRDTMEQERVKIEDLKAYFEKKFEY